MKAFPIPSSGYQNGMDLRDYFAAKAMQAIITSDSYDDGIDVPELAYAMADAMLAERNE